MAFTINMHYIRPSTDVAWPHTCPWLTAEQLAEKDQYWQTTYIDTGLILERTFTTSDNGLELDVTTVFKDEAAHQEFQSDFTWWDRFFSERSKYVTDNNVSMNLTINA